MFVFLSRNPYKCGKVANFDGEEVHLESRVGENAAKHQTAVAELKCLKYPNPAISVTEVGLITAALRVGHKLVAKPKH